MTARSLFGMETEYALRRGTAPGPWDRDRVCQALQHAVRLSSRPSLPEASAGLGCFLANGARFYIDRGGHPEYATPECEDPWQATACAQAGDLLLEELLAEATPISPMAANTVVFRSNVDYSRRGVTWGCHESYLHTIPSDILPDHLLPHLATRIIYAGAGGFHPTAPGIEFTLSPRAWLLTAAVTPHSTSERGIIHLKHEPLAGMHWQRLHLICGESLCSDRAAVLKLGTTALVLAAINAGAQPARTLRLADPVEALRTIAADMTLSATVRLADGRQATALEMQRSLLAMVEHHRRRGALPSWARDLCGLWRETLDGLERRDQGILRQLDWSLKLEIFRRWIRRKGIDARVLEVWCGAIRRLERVALRIFEGSPLAVEDLLANQGRFYKELDRLSPVIRHAGVEWHQARELIRLRHELLEADLRFGQVTPAGVFAELRRCGFAGGNAGRPLPDPKTLVDEPPPGGRAEVRGREIRALWERGLRSGYRADWYRLHGPPAHARFEMADPFCTRGAWIGPEELARIVASVAQAGL
jgi:hypothetical protein